MRASARILAGAAGWLLVGAGEASAAVVIPQIGTVATESVVGGNRSYSDPTYPYGFHSTGGLGTPGTSQPTYNPKGYFGDLASASYGYDREGSGDGRTVTYAAGSAAADLYSGQIHLDANGMFLGSGVNGTSVAYISSSASMSDVIGITGAITSPVQVRLSVVIDGGFTGTGIGTVPPANTTAYFDIGTGGGNYAQVMIHDFTGSSVDIVDQSGLNGTLTVQSSAANALQLTLTETVTVTDTSRRIAFLLGGQVSAVPNSPGTISGGFGNTARLVLDLPDGLGFTSQSGVLLTAAQDTDAGGGSMPMPEPGTALLLVLPLAALAAVARPGGPGRATAAKFS